MERLQTRSSRVSWSLSLAIWIALPAIADITYVYDENGRLTGVVNHTGDAATYSYDASGNITSVSRISSTQTSIIGYSPASGTVGTVVTISGTGFSTTASQNSVSFNGVAATVTSSTTSKIVTSVPSGTTTGPISVTNSNGSATSSASFTVGQALTPSISGFTPTSGTAGTSVTVNGSNFDTTVSNNIVAFANINAVVSSASATSLGVTVPTGATSGHVSVTTPNGTAFSSADFFVPPATFSSSDIGWTGRLAFGVGTAVTLSAANKIGLAVFDGVYGQRISLNISSASFTNSVTCKILNPDGSTLASISCGSGAFIDTKVLPATGVYTVIVDPASTGTGSATLTLYDVPPNVDTSITAGGSAASVTTTAPGQNASLTFSGTSGQRVSIAISGATFPNCATYTLKNPDGTTLVSSSPCGASGFIDTQMLTATGVHTLVVDPTGTGTGSATITLYSVPADVTGTITPGGAPVSITTTVPGQNAKLTFSGTAGQRVSLKASSPSFNGFADCQILKSDGTSLGFVSCSTGTSFIEPKSLPTTGAYTVLVNPNTAAIGSVTLTLFDVPADITGSIDAGGSPVTVTTTTPGQNASLTFSGTSGQRISLSIASATFPNCASYTIKKPDGTTLVSSNPCGASGFIDTTVLPTTGTYTIAIDPTGVGTGSATLTLYDVPADTSGSVTIGGSGATTTISTPGQNGKITFAGTASQSATVRLTSNSLGSVTITLRKPDGTSLTSMSSSSASFNLSTQTLPVAGTYSIDVNPSGSNVGSITVAVTSP